MGRALDQYAQRPNIDSHASTLTEHPTETADFSAIIDKPVFPGPSAVYTVFTLYTDGKSDTKQHILTAEQSVFFACVDDKGKRD
ncbi:hypothetical protein RvY_16960 [Ramazzottius varieornatus]|uniref:Uncharacterized protein n=1 Tax=Ramazzottius varieornatus TaxID=947166 RepID=A0A1D1W4K2_RAMVA|nr:hypothetical protein RvY_16960 [Ramazzottius varieornatus]